MRGQSLALPPAHIRLKVHMDGPPADTAVPLKPDEGGFPFSQIKGALQWFWSFRFDYTQRVTHKKKQNQLGGIQYHQYFFLLNEIVLHQDLAVSFRSQ